MGVRGFGCFFVCVCVCVCVCVLFVCVFVCFLWKRSLHLLFRNVNPEKMFDFLKENGAFYEIRGAFVIIFVTESCCIFLGNILAVIEKVC